MDETKDSWHVDSLACGLRSNAVEKQPREREGERASAVLSAGSGNFGARVFLLFPGLSLAACDSPRGTTGSSCVREVILVRREGRRSLFLSIFVPCCHTLTRLIRAQVIVSAEFLPGGADNFVSRARVVRDTCGLRHAVRRCKRRSQSRGENGGGSDDGGSDGYTLRRVPNLRAS